MSFRIEINFVSLQKITLRLPMRAGGHCRRNPSRRRPDHGNQVRARPPLPGINRRLFAVSIARRPPLAATRLHTSSRRRRHAFRWPGRPFDYTRHLFLLVAGT